MLPLIYIIDLSRDLFSKAKFFPEDTSLFYMVHDINISANKRNNDLKKVSNWGFQWKMCFHPNPSKQAQEIIFSQKLKKVPHHPLVSNNVNVSQCKSRKHLGIILDSKLTFEDHYTTTLIKTNRTIRSLHNLPNLLPREALITVYKAFDRYHLGYGDFFFSIKHSMQCLLCSNGNNKWFF